MRVKQLKKAVLQVLDMDGQALAKLYFNEQALEDDKAPIKDLLNPDNKETQLEVELLI